MAVRGDWTPNEVLKADDLNDTFAARPAATGTAPTNPTVGEIWFNTSSTPPKAFYWDGAAWKGFSLGAGTAAISSPAPTGRYTDAEGTWDYYEFTASGTLTVDTAGFADALVVGGGGGGGNAGSGATSYGGGGGGAGGHLHTTNVYLPVGSWSVVVGAGGAGGGQVASNGVTSRINDIFAFGGGAGGEGGPSNAVGGSGGGGSGTSGLAGKNGVPGQGNDGGDSGGLPGSGGGGGGAGAAGGNGTAGTTATVGLGGSGVDNSITNASVTRCAGGDGGPSNADVSGSSAPANTGNGGNAGGIVSGGNQSGGNGGSGIVIVRVKV